MPRVSLRKLSLINVAVAAFIALFLFLPSAVRAVEDKVAFLTEKLKESDSFKVRLKAAVLLGRMEDPRAVAPLERALRDDNYVVRGAAARALGNLGHALAASSVEQVLPLVVDEETFVRQEARRALVRLAGPDSVDPFVAALSSDKTPVRLAAVHVLATLALPEARSAMVQTLGDEDEEVRAEAVVAIMGLAQNQRDNLIIQALRPQSRYQVQATAARMAGDLKLASALQGLAELSVSDEVVPEVRREAEEAIRQMRDDIDMARLLPDLQSKDRHRQTLAIKMLGLHGGRSSVDALLGLLKDLDIFVRRRVVHALGDAGDPRAVPSLEFLLKNEDSAQFQEQIRRTLRRIRP